MRCCRRRVAKNAGPTGPWCAQHPDRRASMNPYRTSHRRATRLAIFSAQLLPLFAFLIRAMAQTTAADSPSTVPASSNPGGAIAIVVVVVALLMVIGVGVKLYDRKRKREEEVMALQSLISDALLLDPSLARLPITAFAGGSLWRRSPVVITITGTVPTPEQREAVMRLVVQALSRRHAFARPEDRLVVDPLMQKQTARPL